MLGTRATLAPTGESYGPLKVGCNNYQIEGIAPLIQNKTWQMVQMYADSIPMDTSVSNSYQFIFRSDTVQTSPSLLTADTLLLLRKVIDPFGNPQWAGLRFHYSINQSQSTISLFQRQDNSLQKVFKLVCLTAGHLAFQFTENATDQQGNAIIANMEYRFLVDYTLENAQAH